MKKIPFAGSIYRFLNNDSKKSSTSEFIEGVNNRIRIDEHAKLSNCKFTIIGNENIILIDRTSVLKNVTFYINGNENTILISEGVKFNIGGNLWIEDNKCEIKIGKDSTFEEVHLAATEPGSKIIIGEDCMFAYDIDLRTGDSHSLIDTTTNKRINYAKNIEIENHVWVAAHVSILKGVKLKENTVVATRALVTKAFDKKGILLGGVPAKELKENINWDRKRIYDETK